MAPIITPADLASYPGIPSGTDVNQAVELANGLISDIIGELDPVPTKAKAIALAVVKRGLTNPDGAQSITKGIDDWKKTVTYPQGDQFDAGFYLTDAEETALRRLVGRSSVGSIRLRVPGYAADC